MFRMTPCSTFLSALAISALTLGMLVEADARPQRAAGHARATVNYAPPANAQRAQRVGVRPATQYNTQVNAPRRVNAGNTVGNRVNVDNSTRNVNINNQRDVDIDVDGGGRYGYDDHYHPIAAAAAVTATVVATSAVVGAIFSPTQMPSDCVQVVRYNIAYLQCGSTWFQPQYQGSNVTYVVVNAP